MVCIDCFASFIKTKVNSADILVIMVLMVVALWVVALITWILVKASHSFNDYREYLKEITKKTLEKQGDSSENKNHNTIINHIESEDLLVLGRYSVIIVSALSFVIVTVIIGLVVIIKIW